MTSFALDLEIEIFSGLKKGHITFCDNAKLRMFLEFVDTINLSINLLFLAALIVQYISGFPLKFLKFLFFIPFDPFLAGIIAKTYSGKWYRETGSGMGATINVAIGMGGYTLSDRATWIKFSNKKDFTVLFQGDKILFNQYGVMLINKLKCPTVKSKLGQKFIDWLISSRGQKSINSYKVKGKQLFFGNAIKN